MSFWKGRRLLCFPLRVHDSHLRGNTRTRRSAAIDLIDEACAKLKNELTSKPTIIDEVDRRIIQLEMERLSIKSDVEKSQNDADFKRLQHLESSLLQLYDQQAELNARWKAEREAVLGTNELQEKIAEVQLEIEKAEREYDLNKAAELKYGTLPQLEEQLERAMTKEADGGGDAKAQGKPMLRDEVMPDDIANVISGTFAHVVWPHTSGLSRRY